MLASVVLAGCAGDGSGQPDAAPGDGSPLPAVTVTGTPGGSTGSVVDPSGPVAGGDPCALVSRAEAEKLAGTALDDGQPVRETCTYTGPVTGPTAQVEVYVGAGAAKYLDIERSLDHELRPLVGVGDEAYAGGDVVFVRKADQWVSVRLVRLNDPTENVQPLEEIARVVATRI